MSAPLDLIPPSAEPGMVSLRVSLFEQPDSTARLAQAIAAAGGRVHTLATLRTLPDVEVVEMELCVEQLSGPAVATALRSVVGILRVAPPTGAPLLERRMTRVGGQVQWPGLGCAAATAMAWSGSGGPATGVGRAAAPAVMIVRADTRARVWPMGDRAGVVNDGGHANDTAFSDVIAAASEEVQELARGVRDLVFDVLPETIEVAWPQQRSVGWGSGPKKFTEQFAYLMPFKRHVTLGFYHGGELPDPTGLLPPSGNKQVTGSLSMRSLKIRALEDVHQPALRELVDASTRHRVPAPGM